MKWGILSALMIGLPFGAVAQEPPAAAPTSEVAAATTFELKVDAPDAIRDLLNTHLEIKRYREVSDLSDNELRRLMLVAKEDSRALLGTIGYFSPEIQAELDITDGERRRTVTLTVVPGEPTLVSDVNLTFTGAISQDPTTQLQREKIQNDWSFRNGMRFTQVRWDAAKLQALRQLTNERFPAGQLGESLADIDPTAHLVRLNVTLDSGPNYRLGKLQINGLERYDEELVTRLARLPVGADYDQLDLVAAQRRLANSGYFDSAYVSIDTSGDPENAPVVVQLREGKLKKIVLGVGISTDSGPRLSLEHTNHKLPWLGWRALSKISLDNETRAISTELTAPPDMDNWRWITSAQIQNQNTGGVDVTSQRWRGGRRQDSDRIDRSYYLEYDRADTASSTNALPIVAQSLSVNYAFTLRSFDSMPFPSSGWGLGVEVGGGTTLGGQRDPFSRVLARGRYYFSLADSNDNAATQLRSGRIVLRAEGGAVIAKDGISLPSTQLFLTGGDTTVRGYSYRELGVTQTSGLVAPGRYMVNGGVEWQSPLISDGQVTDWEGALFVDAGGVADAPSNLNHKVGVGAGVRWKSPIGPLQIDLAYGLDTQRLRLHMNVGFNF
ncbi:autotransporter assembly complex family protein [Rhodoferax sp. PAMC 29310]|uniref:autotransporter assembly complex protein TamA n=1 Tax=Rhodoferax sp. PAMC 29310 TaxID=2822760 RepID=UPI001B329802|nr:autotransporter assembly complex family protein [Rhodoferax sp. PAMC 29310]